MLSKFLLAWAFLNVVANLRYPGGERPLWYLLPAWDVVVVFVSFALVRARGWRVPKAVHVALVVLFCLVRVLRLGDGFQEHYYAERFTLYSDLPLLPELVRFGHSTLPAWKFWALAGLLVVTLTALPLATYRALVVAERYLGERTNLPVVGLVALLGFGIGFSRRGQHPVYQVLLGWGFGRTTVPRLYREASFLVGVYTEKAARVGAIDRVTEELRRTPSNLAKLGGRNVLLFLVESYGETVVERPEFVRTIRPTFSAIEQELAQKGFFIASNRLNSPTYGGHSWLAHATLQTGVRTTDQLQYDLVFSEKPQPLASFFREAGYRTVLAQPATTRPWAKGEVYRFDKRYSSWEFDYHGPTFGWAKMPDQYVLDFIDRREVARARGPLFVEYVLVSSHAPWSDLPTVVDDWSRLGNGAIYRSWPALHFGTAWPKFTNASEAYIRSIVYDFDVLRRYLAERVNDDSLVIILGDHQPLGEVNGHSASQAVPIHVLSRNRAFIDTFVASGYVQGMWPRRGGEVREMERFLPDFLRAFSTPAAQAHSK